MEKKSLINICLDLVELDQDAPENKELIESRFNMLGEKVDNYIGIYKFSESQIDMLKNEVEFLNNQIKQFEKLQENLKKRAEQALTALGETSIKSENGHKISIRESESVEVIDIEKVPDEYVKIKVSMEPDKVSIKYAIKQGKEIQGCKLSKNKNIIFK